MKFLASLPNPCKVLLPLICGAPKEVSTLCLKTAASNLLVSSVVDGHSFLT